MRLKPFALSLESFRIVRNSSRMTLYRTGSLDRFAFPLISEKVIEKRHSPRAIGTGFSEVGLKMH